jgi:hypothetical protein
MFVKKSLGLGLLIGLLAMAFAALPAMASAATLTEKGVSVPAGVEGKGATVVGTSVNSVTTLAGGTITIKCAKVTVKGIVTVNSGGKVEISMEKEKVDSATECTANGSPTTISPTQEGINLSGTTGTAKFTFTGGGLSEASTSTVSWVGPDATSAHVEGPVTGTLSGTFKGDFTFETKDGTPLTLD